MVFALFEHRLHTQMISFPVVRLTDEHFIHDDTQGPPVAQLVVSGLHEDLGGDVVGGPHSGISLGVTDRQSKGPCQSRSLKDASSKPASSVQSHVQISLSEIIDNILLNGFRIHSSSRLFS